VNDAELSKQVETYRQELNALSRDGLTVERQQRQVDADKEAYLSYLRKGEEARAAEALNQSKILNISVAQPPILPLRPDFPDVLLNLLVGAIAAVGLGLAAARFEDQRDPRLYSARSVEQVSGLPTVATLPDAF
jgi:polysaccharide biosynthesis transport protein